MYKAKINDDEFEVTASSNGAVINDTELKIIAQEIKRVYTVDNGGKQFRAQIISMDLRTKKSVIKVAQNRYEVDIKDKMDIVLERMGIDTDIDSQISTITAPMPGLILDVCVKVGDLVEKNDKLAVLEAMKMENNIKSPAAGEVKSIKVKTGDRVERAQVLIEF